MHEQISRVTISLCGKTYVISTHHTQEHMSQACASFEKTLDMLSASQALRDDQRLLFAAVLSVADALRHGTTAHTTTSADIERLISVCDAAIRGE